MDENQEIFKVDGMMCAGCASGVEKALLGMDGVLQARVNLEEKNVSVSYDTGKTNFRAMHDVLIKSMELWL